MLRREIEAVQEHCEKDRRLRPLFDRVFTRSSRAADQVVLSSAWPQRAGWSMNLLELHYFQSAEGGKRVLSAGRGSAQRSDGCGGGLAELLFTCTALGFQGELLGEKKELEERRRRQVYEGALAGCDGSCSPLMRTAATRRAIARGCRRWGTLRCLLIAVCALLFMF